jgi:predicted component of type VI protein secretion system
MRLTVEQGTAARQDFTLEQPMVIIGRGKDCNMVLLDHNASRQHARLEYCGQGWTLTDLGSTNGTVVNGQPLRPYEAYPLHPGDRIVIGNTVLAAQEDKAPAGMPGGSTAQTTRSRQALRVGGAVLLVLALAAIVVVLVIALRPREALTTPTPMDQVEQIMTALPVPTELRDIVTSVVPLIPTGLPLLSPGETATPPTPDAAIPNSVVQANGQDAG